MHRCGQTGDREVRRRCWERLKVEGAVHRAGEPVKAQL